MESPGCLRRLGGITTQSSLHLPNSRLQTETDAHREEWFERAALLSFSPTAETVKINSPNPRVTLNTQQKKFPLKFRLPAEDIHKTCILMLK